MKSVKVQHPICGIVAIFLYQKFPLSICYFAAQHWFSIVSFYFFLLFYFWDSRLYSQSWEVDDVVVSIYQKSKLVSIERSKLRFPAGSQHRSDEVLLLKIDLSACLRRAESRNRNSWYANPVNNERVHSDFAWLVCMKFYVTHCSVNWFVHRTTTTTERKTNRSVQKISTYLFLLCDAIGYLK